MEGEMEILNDFRWCSYQRFLENQPATKLTLILILFEFSIVLLHWLKTWPQRFNTLNSGISQTTKQMNSEEIFCSFTSHYNALKMSSMFSYHTLS